MYTLSIDLGTTYTAAAVLDESGVPAMVGLGNRAMQVPSVLYANPDGTFLVGEAAERQAGVDPTRVRREIKRRIGDSVPILIAGSPHSAAELTGHLLRFVVDRCTERYGEAPSRIVVTHPASWRQFKLDVLREAASLTGLPPILMVPEPVAAAMYYASHTRVADSARICVYDLGGGTFDVCILAKEPHSFRILGVPEGIEELGGVDFDEAVFRRVLDEAADPAAIDPTDPGLYRLRRDCVEAKEALSEEVNVSVTVSIAGEPRSVRLTRAEFEDMIAPSIDMTITATARALHSAGVDPTELTSIVLVGGSSRIPLVTELLTKAFRCPIAHDTHPKHDIALGAVLTTTEDPPTPDLEAVAATAALPPTDVTQATNNQRRRRSRILAISVAATAALILGFAAVRAIGSSVSNPDQLSSPSSGLASVAGTPGSGTTASASDSGTNTATHSESTEPSSAPPSTATPTSPSPTVPAPPTFDETTTAWLITVCGAGADIESLSPQAGSSYPNLTAMQFAFVDSYEKEASVARATSETLEGRMPAVIAGGRIDPQASIDNMRRLAEILGSAAQSMRALAPQDRQDILTVVTSVNNTPSVGLFNDLSQLSSDESGYVKRLRGCESLGD